MGKKIKIVLILFAMILIATGSYIFFSKQDNEELKTIKSERQLQRMYEGKEWEGKETLINILTMPFSFVHNGLFYGTNGILASDFSTDYVKNSGIYSTDTLKTTDSINNVEAAGSISESTTATTKDYSTTNIQVENVDEADITKTDGDYIYSISDNNVIITDVKNPEDINIASKISLNDRSIPEDLILYENKLVVIATKSENASYSYYRYNYENNTIVKIYNITDRKKPNLVKSYELYEPYYTSRCINNMLYVISSGYLRKEDDKVVRTYKEDSIEKDMPLDSIKYLKSMQTDMQTLISVVDLNNPKADVNISSYLIDISNAYVSQESIYLLNDKYEYNHYKIPIKKLFGLKGAIGIFTYDDYDYDYGYKTEIYKFNIEKDGNISYTAKNKTDGKTINQYSLDELNGHLRVALYDDNGARIAIFDGKLKQIGVSNYVAKGENMYSSRFMGNKAYLVTYKTMDPLFVIDLSNETKPKVLGELSIPGYSTYLHPYDENHLIGIGMETKEIVNRNSSGKITSVTDRIIGMKMALFDVSDVSNPIQISSTIIGDSRTTSAILTNPKALLFSKERELIAIPVNNYEEDFEIDSSNNDTYDSIYNLYTNYNKSYVAEGYFVYKINLQDGFKLKGVITHQKEDENKNKRYNYYYYNNSKLLRGLYIENNLYTISEEAVKVNNLDTLDLVDELKIK